MTNFLELEKVSIRKIYLFNEIVSHLSLRKAASSLGISPQALRYEIKKIEESIGSPLYTTNNNRICLTEEGKRFAEFAKETLNLYVFKKLGTLDKIDTPLSIASTYGVNEIFLSKIILNFKQKYPDLQFKILAGREYMDFASYEVDIVLGPKIQSRPELSQTSLIKFEYFLYASQDYLNRMGRPSSLLDLKKHKLLIFNPDQSSYISELPIENSYIQSNCYRLLFEMAEAGLGIIPLTHNMVEGYGNPQNKMTKLLDISCEQETFFFIYHKHSAKIGLIKEFQEECLTYFNNLRTSA
jgi:DNA-binding transcriptional LysR family regulator